MSDAISFPCEYPVKIIGEQDGDFAGRVLAIVQRHAPEVEGFAMQVRESRNRNYVALTVRIWASGEPQLRALHQDLMLDRGVRLVL